MPFVTAWTDDTPENRARSTMRWHWEKRATLRPESWSLQFLVRLDGQVVGTQGLGADEFAVTRQVRTGSWLGLRHQGRGIGTEMRTAVLLFAFDHLGATHARSAAFVDNPASLRVSEKLGYRPDGTEVVARRGKLAEDVRLLLERGALRRPAWTMEVEGLEACLPMLGITDGGSPPGVTRG